MSSRNEHHEFEEIATRIARERISANILIATGPVSSGEDQQRDTETYETGISEELPHSAGFSASASTKPIVVACTVQRTRLKEEVLADLAGICAALFYGLKCNGVERGSDAHSVMANTRIAQRLGWGSLSRCAWSVVRSGCLGSLPVVAVTFCGGAAAPLPSAITMLVPQMEQLLRQVLKANGVHTLTVDEQMGVESERDLGALLMTEEAEHILGSGLRLELRALFVEKGGANLRNEVAHGLLTDGAAFSLGAVYAWWLCLRVVVLPLWMMRHDTVQDG